MVYLAIETSSRKGSAALLQEQQVLSVADFAENRTAGMELLVRLRSLLAEAGRGPRDLGGIAVSVGPGTYTGIRLGVTAAKTLGFACQVPVVGVESLTVLAAGALLAPPPRSMWGRRSTC